MAARSCGRRLRLRSVWIRVMDRISRRRLPVGLGLSLGLDSVSLRRLVLLQRLRMGMGAGRRLRSLRLGIRRRRPARQHRCVSFRLSDDSRSGSRSRPGKAAHPCPHLHARVGCQARAARAAPDRRLYGHADRSTPCRFGLWWRSHRFLPAPRLPGGFKDPRACPRACRDASGGRLYRAGIGSAARPFNTRPQPGDASRQASARNFI